MPRGRYQVARGHVIQLRQSDLSTWARCPLAYRYQNIDHMPRLQSGALSFGTIIHDCVLFMETHQDLPGAIARFNDMWLCPEAYDELLVPAGTTLKIDYYTRGASWKKSAGEGPRMLSDWWGIIQWDSDTVLAREYEFDVPIGDGHILHGTIDKLALRFLPKTNEQVVLISDYKTNAKTPTYDWLEDNLQFTAYAYASTQPEFWTGFPDADMFGRVSSLRRQGEWVGLKGPKRLNAGFRDQVQYNRLTYAINAVADSIAMRIFVPNISGETCRYCEFRALCGLPEVPDDV